MTYRDVADPTQNDDKVTPVDADRWMVVDSETAPDSLKEMTHANMKVWIKAYCDTLYTGLSAVNIAPTTANITATLNAVHFADISGLTAARNFVIPAPDSVGDRIILNIKVGDPTYAFVPIGDTSITIDGGSAATAWTKGPLFITGESIELVADTTTNWQVVIDKRIPCKGTMRRIGTNPQTIAHNTTDKIDHDTEDVDIGDIVDIANSKFVIRRAGTYQIISQVYFAAGLALRWIDIIYKNGVQYTSADESTHNAGCFAVPTCNPQLTLAATDYIEQYCYHNQGGNINVSPSAGAEAFIIIEEKL